MIGTKKVAGWAFGDTPSHNSTRQKDEMKREK